MPRHDQNEDERIVDNLRRTIELTELALALRQAVLQQGASEGNAMAEVMRDIRRAKEQAWRLNPSYLARRTPSSFLIERGVTQ